MILVGKGLGRARLEGLPHYHGEILNEATEHNLDLTPFQVLVAATENEAYNALVCNEFAHEIGRDMVYQLGENQDKESRTALPESIRGRALFEDGFGVDEVNDRVDDGWVFKKTKLSEEFDFEDAQGKLPEDAKPALDCPRERDLTIFHPCCAARASCGRHSDFLCSAQNSRAKNSRAQKTGEGQFMSSTYPIALAALSAILLAGCKPVPQESEAPAEPMAPPTEEAEPVSILRPDVEAETEQEDDASLEAFTATIGFPDGGSELDADAIAALEQVAASEQFAGPAAIVLRAHSDSAGSDASNERAAQARGLAVAEWLIAAGADPRRIDVIVFGEQNPVEPNALPDGSPNEEGRAANRRVDVEIAALAISVSTTADVGSIEPSDEP